MAYKAIIFDFFDVIHRDPFNHWLRQNGLERVSEMEESANQFDAGNIDLEEHYRRVSRAAGKPIDNIRISFEDISFIDRDVVELIKNLKKTYKTGLLSNTADEYISPIIEQHGLRPLFDAITISADVGLIKPDPRIFEHILGELDVSANEAIFIDDNPRNTEAASRQGIKSITYNGDIIELKQELTAAGVKLGF